jgi:hypothetical protein
MKDAPDINQLRELSQRELAETYCERIVYSIVGDAKKSSTQSEPPAQ